jgi:4a-hydroxytetrahydrobiopterin dehydratase
LSVARISTEDLLRKSCAPARKGTPSLTAEQAREYVAAVPGWQVSPDAKQISREWTFKDFVEAMAFVNRVAVVAEAEQHHPDIVIHWNRVTLVLWTHSIGGLHENDFVMAAKVDVL